MSAKAGGEFAAPPALNSNVPFSRLNTKTPFSAPLLPAPLDQLDHVSQRYLRPETLKAANRVLVDFHHRLPLSAAWGQGISSSSDGQRFGVQASSLLASFYPRYFGY